jgi:hypothetical protein
VGRHVDQLSTRKFWLYQLVVAEPCGANRSPIELDKLIDMEGVPGSIPGAPTKEINDLAIYIGSFRLLNLAPFRLLCGIRSCYPGPPLPRRGEALGIGGLDVAALGVWWPLMPLGPAAPQTAAARDRNRHHARRI